MLLSPAKICLYCYLELSLNNISDSFIIIFFIIDSTLYVSDIIQHLGFTRALSQEPIGVEIIIATLIRTD